MYIKKRCPHFVHQEDDNGEMVIGACGKMRSPEQDYEGDYKVLPCPFRFEDKPCYTIVSEGSDAKSVLTAGRN